MNKNYKKEIVFYYNIFKLKLNCSKLFLKINVKKIFKLLDKLFKFDVSYYIMFNIQGDFFKYAHPIFMFKLCIYKFSDFSQYLRSITTILTFDFQMRTNIFQCKL